MIPPITACATTPSGCTSASRVSRGRRGRVASAATRHAPATMTTRNVSSRLPNSIHWVSACVSGCGDGHQAAGEALRPRRAAQPGPGDPHDRPGDGDARLRDHGGDRQRAHDARRGGRQAVEQRHGPDASAAPTNAHQVLGRPGDASRCCRPREDARYELRAAPCEAPPGSPITPAAFVATAPGDPRQRQRTSRTAASPPASPRPPGPAPAARSGRRRGEGGAQAVGERRGGQPLRHGGEPARHLVDRHDDPADEHQHQPDEVGDGQRDLGAQACRRRGSPTRRTPRSPAARAAAPSPRRRRRAASPTRARSP